MDRVVFTPYFMGAHVPGLEHLARPSWQRNAAAASMIEAPSAGGRSSDPGSGHSGSGDIQRRMLALYRPLAEQVAAIARAGDRPVSFAGDCCSAIGMLAGLQRAGVHPSLFWLDAHGDFNTWDTSPSGFLGGMPLAMLTGRGEQTMPQALGLARMTDAKVILSDARDLDPGEWEALHASGVDYVPRFDDLLVRVLPPGPLYVHLDVDVVDPQEAPAMDFPASGGPTAAQVRDFLKLLEATGRLVAVSVSAWNPEKETDGRTERAIMGVLQPLLRETM